MFNYSPPELNNRILCSYTNSTKQIQMIRITNIPNCDFEKIVFPQQRLMFEADSEAELEIYSEIIGFFILFKQIKCHFFRAKE